MSTPGTEFFHATDRAQTARTLAQEFRTAYGTDPEGVWSAPGRVNLIGEHVDYTGGLCLPLALPHRTFVALRPRTDGVVRVRSLQEPSGVVEVPLAEVGAGSPQGWAAYVAGVPWALQQNGFEGLALTGGFDALVDGHVPYGSGLSSSAALECAVAVALGELVELPLDDTGRAGLASACQLAENVVAGANTGGMDQAASLRCHEGGAILLDTDDDSVTQVALDLAGPGSRCSSSTPAPSTRTPAGSTASAAPTSSGPRNSSGWRTCAPSTRPVSTPRSSAWAPRPTGRCWSAASGTPSPRSSGSAAPPNCSRPVARARSGRCSTPRTTPCATTTRSPAASWT